jgi:cysteine synthase A
MLSGNEWQPHKIQGWTPDFIPGVLDASVVDQLVPVDDAVAVQTSLDLASNEGILVGISSGATLAAGLEIAQSAEPGSVMCVMLPDTGERYLSTVLFEDIPDGSDDEWLASL